jgi:hypothetical protein
MLLKWVEKYGQSCDEVALKMIFYPGEEEKLTMFFSLQQKTFYLLKGFFIEMLNHQDGNESVIGLYSSSDCPYSYQIINDRHIYLKMMGMIEIEVIDRNHHDHYQILLESTQQMFVMRNKREYLLSLKTILHKYEHFVKGYPDLLCQLPQYLLASYLGVTPQSLSRTRALRVKKN